MLFRESNWYTIEFTFRMYPGETYENTEDKVISSLNNFPNHVQAFSILNKRRTGDWNHLIQLTVELGVPESVSLEEVLKKFDNVTHLQNRKIVD